MKGFQLFCFTHAGGTTAFFDEIEADLPEIEVVKLEYSGHGKRRKEKQYVDFAELADDMFKKIYEAYRGGNYALFGYSMGAIAVYEVLKRIASCSDFKQPNYIFLAACNPHTRWDLIKLNSPDEVDNWIIDRTIRYGTVPDELISSELFWRMYLPIYRKDYTLIGNYRFEDSDYFSTIPAVIFYAEEDTRYSEIVDWKKYFVCECDFYKFEGKHFFINLYHTEMAKIIMKIVRKCSIREVYD